MRKIGRFLDTISNYKFYRQLSSEEYVLLDSHNNLFVVDKEEFQKLANQALTILQPLNNRIEFYILRFSFLIILILNILMWDGISIKSVDYFVNSLQAIPLTKFLILLVMIAVSSLVHELGHMVWGRICTVGAVRFDVFSSTVTTRLNHIWFWEKLDAALALLAGVLIDVLFYNISGYIFFGFLREMIQTALFLRIIWQFGFHRRSDGRFLLKILVDDPLLETRGRRSVYPIFYVIGLLIDFYLMVAWFLPMVRWLIWR